MLLIASMILLIAFFTLAACQPAGVLLSADGMIECGGDGKAIKLVNNPKAYNPMYDELVVFIKSDITDSREYIEAGPAAYVCADFAEEVHNNAEAAGFRAGWVGVTFIGTDDGHAINAFETVDKGLVYIDCTNGGSTNVWEKEPQSWDTVAYIKKGSKYGVIHIDEAKSMQYDFYVEYEKEWREYKKLLEAYNEEVARYNEEVSQNVYTIGSPEERRITAWKKDLLEQEQLLESLEEELGDYWYESEFADYVIKDVLIHW